jgi:hypothetical protein
LCSASVLFWFFHSFVAIWSRWISWHARGEWFIAFVSFFYECLLGALLWCILVKCFERELPMFEESCQLQPTTDNSPQSSYWSCKL